MPAFVNTELIAGTNELKGVKRQNPEDVAEAVVEALQYGALRRLRAEVARRPRPLVRADAALVLRVARPQDGRLGAAGRRQGRPRGLRGARRAERARPPRRSWPRPRPTSRRPRRASSPASRRSLRRAAVPGPPAGSARRLADPAGRGLPERARERLADLRRQHRVLRRPTASASAAGRSRSASSTRLPSAAPGASGVCGIRPRERARPGLRGHAGERRVVGGGDLVAGVGVAAAAHEHADRQVLGALDEVVEARARRRSSAAGR